MQLWPAGLLVSVDASAGHIVYASIRSPAARVTPQIVRPAAGWSAGSSVIGLITPSDGTCNSRFHDTL